MHRNMAWLRRRQLLFLRNELILHSIVQACRPSSLGRSYCRNNRRLPHLLIMQYTFHRVATRAVCRGSASVKAKATVIVAAAAKSFIEAFLRGSDNRHGGASMAISSNDEHDRRAGRRTQNMHRVSIRRY